MKTILPDLYLPFDVGGTFLKGADGLAGVQTLRHVGTVSDIDHAAFNGILAELITTV